MDTVLSALLLAIAIVGACFVWRKTLLQRQRTRLDALTLTPNCLLTRYPILILTRPQSLFRPFDIWMDVAVYLREHGYQVEEIDAENADLVARISARLPTGSAALARCHIIASERHAAQLRKLARLNLLSIQSLTLVTQAHSKTEGFDRSSRHERRGPEDLKPQGQAIDVFELKTPTHTRPWSFAHQFLPLAISLAEQDLKCSD